MYCRRWKKQKKKDNRRALKSNALKIRSIDHAWGWVPGLKVVKITLPTEQHNTSSANRARPMNRKFPERTTVDGKQFYQACPYSPRFRDGGVTTLPGVGRFFFPGKQGAWWLFKSTRFLPQRERARGRGNVGAGGYINFHYTQKWRQRAGTCTKTTVRKPGSHSINWIHRNTPPSP